MKPISEWSRIKDAACSERPCRQDDASSPRTRLNERRAHRSSLPSAQDIGKTRASPLYSMKIA